MTIKTLVIATLMAGASLPIAAAQVGGALLIDEDFETFPTGYELLTVASQNGTADIQIGPVGGSMGLDFDGTWAVAPGGREDAYGYLFPFGVQEGDFQVDPATTGGIAGVDFTLDTVVTSATIPTDLGLFAILLVFQQQPDNSIEQFGYGLLVAPNTSEAIDVTLTAADFTAFGPATPDFGPEARPLSFGLQLGATFLENGGVQGFTVDGQITADNWTVRIGAGDDDIYSNGFEIGNDAMAFGTVSIRAEKVLLR